MAVMSGRVRVLFDSLRGSYWLVPALMVAAAVLLSVLTSSLDLHVVPDTRGPWGRWMSTAGPEGARAVLTTIAASMITLASLSYSLTLVALTLAAGQYGPRLLRTFMRDRVTQVGLGAFLATFVFCIGALRGVRSDGETSVVPHVSVAAATTMAGLCLAYLVYFIHHVASSINATSVVAAASRELMASLGDARAERPRKDDVAPQPGPPPGAVPVHARSTGYVTVADHEGLVSIAEACDGQMWVDVRPGDFVVEGDVLARLACREGKPPLDDVRRALVLGAERTMIQDVEFGVVQLVEVALRALSPGINDPFTAIACVDRLSAALIAMAGRPPATTVLRDGSGTRRVTRLRVESFDGALRAAMDPLRQAARTQVAVQIRLVEALARIGAATRNVVQAGAVRRQLEMIARSAREAIPEPLDVDDVCARVDEALAGLARARHDDDVT